jgi:hypothetical protein
MGTAAIGCDGFGGRHHMRSKVNYAVAPYSNFEAVVDRIVEVMRAPSLAARFAREGRKTAEYYPHMRFRPAWWEHFRRCLGTEPTACRI